MKNKFRPNLNFLTFPNYTGPKFKLGNFLTLCLVRWWLGFTIWGVKGGEKCFFISSLKMISGLLINNASIYTCKMISQINGSIEPLPWKIVTMYHNNMAQGINTVHFRFWSFCKYWTSIHIHNGQQFPGSWKCFWTGPLFEVHTCNTWNFNKTLLIAPFFKTMLTPTSCMYVEWLSHTLFREILHRINWLIFYYKNIPLFTNFLDLGLPHFWSNWSQILATQVYQQMIFLLVKKFSRIHEF